MVKTLRLIETLLHRSMADLRLVAETRGIAVAPDMPKGELAATLAAELPRPESVRAALAELDVHERLAWNALLEAGGALNSRSFMGYFGHLSGASVRAFRRDAPVPPRPRRVWHPSEGLWYRGLIFSDDSHWEQIYIPDEIRASASEPLPLPVPLLTEVGQPNDLPSDCDILGDIQVALGMMKRQPMKRVRGGELARKNLLALNGALSLPHDLGDEPPSEYSAPYLRFLLTLLHDTGIMALRESHLVPSASAARWLASARHEQARQVWRWYFAVADERVEIGLPGSYGLGSDRNMRVRRAIVDSLRHCPPGLWFSMASFLKCLQHDQPQMLRSWDNGGYPYVIWDREHRTLPASTSWLAAEGLLTRAVFTGALRWMGAVATDKSGDAFMVTSLGAFLLGNRSKWDDEPAPRPLIVQPNFEILAPAEANLLHLFRLDDFADLVKRDRIATYTLTQDSLRRAFEAGETADDVIAFLSEASGRPVPQNVAFTLTEWGCRYGEVEIRNMTVLTVARDSLMEELRASARVKLSVEEPLGPRAVAVAPDDLAGLVKRLRKVGYSPKYGMGAEAAGAAFSPVRLPESELAPLIAAARVVERMAGDRVIPAGLTARLQRLLSQSSRADLEGLVARVERAMQAGKLSSESESSGDVRLAANQTLATLLTALHRGSEVRLEYYDRRTSEPVREQVTPVRVESYRGTQYLVATSTDSESEQRYQIEHIRSAQIVGTGPGRG